LFFPFLQSGIIAGSPEQHRLRPIDAGDPNELHAISRDPNVIGGGCNPLMRSPHAGSQSRRITTFWVSRLQAKSGQRTGDAGIALCILWTALVLAFSPRLGLTCA
jgi:hypothetical protein